MSPERLDDPTAVGHVAGEPIGSPLEQAHTAGKLGRRARRGNQPQARFAKRSRDKAPAKAEGGSARHGRRHVVGGHVEGDEPPVEFGSLDRPLEEILRRVAGGRAAQQRDDLLQRWARHRGIHPCVRTASTTRPSFGTPTRHRSHHDVRGGEESRVAPDRVEVAFLAGEVSKAVVDRDRLREVVDRRRNIAGERVVAGEIVEQEGLPGRGHQAAPQGRDRLVEPAEPLVAPAQS